MEQYIAQDRLGPYLVDILKMNVEKRIVVLGTTCCGKSTLICQIPGARDMDEEIFPLLTPEESAYVCQDPWTPEIGETMSRLVRERLVSKKGQPFFGTVFIDCDLVILLKLYEELLKERCAARGVSISNALAMQKKIEENLIMEVCDKMTIHVGK